MISGVTTDKCSVVLSPAPPPSCSGGKAAAIEHQPAGSEDGGRCETGGDSRVDRRLQWGRHHQRVQVSRPHTRQPVYEE